MSNIPAGRYVGRATGEADFTNSAGGSEGIAARFEITEGEYSGRHVVLYGSFASPASTDIALRQLRDAGWDGDSLTDIGQHTGLGSVDVSIQLQYEQWQGKDKMRVSVWPLDGGALVRDAQKLDEGRKAALAARLQGAVLKSKKGGGSAPAVAPAWASRAASAAATTQEEPWNQHQDEGPPAATGTDDLPF